MPSHPFVVPDYLNNGSNYLYAASVTRPLPPIHLSVKSALFKFAPAMKRVVFGFFLSLFLILAGGYSQLYAHGLQDCASYVPVTSFKPIPPVTDKKYYNIDATTIEEQDDNTTASKKLLDNRIPAGTPKYLLDYYSVRSLETSRTTPSIPSKRCFILLRVFRV